MQLVLVLPTPALFQGCQIGDNFSFFPSNQSPVLSRPCTLSCPDSPSWALTVLSESLCRFFEPNPIRQSRLTTLRLISYCSRCKFISLITVSLLSIVTIYPIHRINRLFDTSLRSSWFIVSINYMNYKNPERIFEGIFSIKPYHPAQT